MIRFDKGFLNFQMRGRKEGACSYEPTEPVPVSYSSGSSTPFSDRLHDLSVAIPRCYKDVCVTSVFLWSKIAESIDTFFIFVF